jgi:hypothetical protein
MNPNFHLKSFLPGLSIGALTTILIGMNLRPLRIVIQHRIDQPESSRPLRVVVGHKLLATPPARPAKAPAPASAGGVR